MNLLNLPNADLSFGQDDIIGRKMRANAFTADSPAQTLKILKCPDGKLTFLRQKINSSTPANIRPSPMRVISPIFSLKAIRATIVVIMIDPPVTIGYCTDAGK